MELDDAPDSLRPLIETVRERVVVPLKEAQDEDAWSTALDGVLEHWLRLRLDLVAAIIELEGEGVLDRLEEAARMVDEVPLTLLPEPAHGAARYAIAMLGGTCAGVLAAARRRRALNLRLLEALIEDIAIIELAWFTIAGTERPRASVAEAAAWEAYSRVRPLRASLARVGLAPALLPAEEPAEATARAREMLARVARGWTEDERTAVASSRR